MVLQHLEDYIWDMMAVKMGNKDVMAVSIYPPEAKSVMGRLVNVRQLQVH